MRIFQFHPKFSFIANHKPVLRPRARVQSAFYSDQKSLPPFSDKPGLAPLYNRVLDHLRLSQGWLARLSTELVIARQLNTSRLQIYFDARLPLPRDFESNIDAILAQMDSGSHPAIMGGRVRFFDTVIELNKGVFIPRPDTENLVEVLGELVKQKMGPPENPVPLRLIDLCTGSGNIPIALVRALPSHALLEINATDLCPIAVALAKKNVTAFGYESTVRIFQGDLFSASGLIPERYHFVCANPPYYSTQKAKTFAHEPQLAIDGGEDGLAIIRRIIAQAPDFLTQNGVLILEIDREQIQPVLDLFNTDSRWIFRAPIEITRGESVVIVATIGTVDIPKNFDGPRKMSTPLIDPNTTSWDGAMFQMLARLLEERIAELSGITFQETNQALRERIGSLVMRCGQILQGLKAGVTVSQLEVIQMHIEAIYLFDLASPNQRTPERYYFNINFLRKKENFFGPIAYYATIFLLMDRLESLLTRFNEEALRLQHLPAHIRNVIKMDSIEELRSRSTAYIDIAKSFTVKKKNKFGERLSLTKQSNWYAVIYGLYYYCREIASMTEAISALDIKGKNPPGG